MVNCWFGALAVWIPGIPRKWKALASLGVPDYNPKPPGPQSTNLPYAELGEPKNWWFVDGFSFIFQGIEIPSCDFKHVFSWTFEVTKCANKCKATLQMLKQHFFLTHRHFEWAPTIVINEVITPYKWPNMNGYITRPTLHQHLDTWNARTAWIWTSLFSDKWRRLRAPTQPGSQPISSKQQNNKSKTTQEATSTKTRKSLQSGPLAVIGRVTLVGAHLVNIYIYN